MQAINQPPLMVSQSLKQSGPPEIVRPDVRQSCPNLDALPCQQCDVICLDYLVKLLPHHWILTSLMPATKPDPKLRSLRTLLYFTCPIVLQHPERKKGDIPKNHSLSCIAILFARCLSLLSLSCPTAIRRQSKPTPTTSSYTINASLISEFQLPTRGANQHQNQHCFHHL